MAEVEDIHIRHVDGYYVARWRDQEYSVPATMQYDDLFDIAIYPGGIFMCALLLKLALAVAVLGLLCSAASLCGLSYF